MKQSAVAPKEMLKAAALMDEGRGHLDAGDRKRAESCFRTAAMTYPTPHAFNNWALCRYLDGDHADTLRILAPLTNGLSPAPFSRALASLARSARGEQAAARDLLNQAIRDLDAGLSRPVVRGEIPEGAWIEYTILIKQAAGALQDHRLILDLHKRWPGRGLPQGAFMGGVAAFNLRKYAQAARYWREIRHPDWSDLMEAHARVADLVERGTVPPFPLEYDPDYEWDETARDFETAKALAARGAVRIRLLAVMFVKTGQEAAAMAASLISATGRWGLDLAQNLLSGSTVPINLKLGAAQALIDAGVYRPDQPIPIVHEGRATSITVKQTEVVDEDPELEHLVAEAIRLRDSGRPEEAYRLLNDLLSQGVAYPAAMMTLANLMRRRGELEEARSLLESVEQMAPDHPAVLLNLAGLWLQKGDLDRARRYADRIDPRGESPEFRKTLALLNQQIRSAGFFQFPSLERYPDAFREEAEEKRISLEVSLAAALKGIPVQWLNAAATLHQVAPTRLRKDRERSLAAALRDPAVLHAALAAEEPQVLTALRFLLEQGGWSKLQGLTRRYGTQDGDGFWWDEDPPTSTIGRLRLLGLLYVGRAMIGGKAHKVAVLPTDLREPLAAVLRALAG